MSGTRRCRGAQSGRDGSGQLAAEAEAADQAETTVAGDPQGHHDGNAGEGLLPAFRIT